LTDSNARRTLRLQLDAEDLGRGLGGLVVTLLDVVRQLLERQALRRVDAGALTEDQIEQLGRALLGLEEGITELRGIFGVSEGDGGLPFSVVDLDAEHSEVQRCQ
jgi:hypothetical protein